jgi:hypothetical protein
MCGFDRLEMGVHFEFFGANFGLFVVAKALNDYCNQNEDKPLRRDWAMPIQLILFKNLASFNSSNFFIQLFCDYLIRFHCFFDSRIFV